MTRDEAKTLKPGDKIIVARKDGNGSPQCATVGKEYVVEHGGVDLVFKSDHNWFYSIQAWLPQLERAPSSDFDPAWPHGHVTRDGRKARVICTDAAGSRPVVALVLIEGKEIPTSFTEKGRLYNDAEDTTLDLINAPAPRPEPIVRKWWALVWPSGEMSTFIHRTLASAEDALEGRSPGWRIIPVEIRELRDDAEGE